MAPSIFSLSSFSRSRLNDPFRLLFIAVPILAFITSLIIIFHIFTTLNLIIIEQHPPNHIIIKPIMVSPAVFTPSLPSNHIIQIQHEQNNTKTKLIHFPGTRVHQQPQTIQATRGAQIGPSKGRHENNKKEEDVFHDRELFEEDYKEMNNSLKIYVYPHKKTDPFANVLLPVTSEPGGNYASESYFKKSLMKSHFITKDPSEADLFYLPFSIASLRHDKRVGVGGIKRFVKDYVSNISHKYPYWNRTGGADHFYVACHSVGRTAMEKAVEVKLNAIQVVCSSSYFLAGYVAHKDASIPQIWPRHGKPTNPPLSNRKKLAFYAGAMNSRVREHLIKVWHNDSDICVHKSRLKTPYSDLLLSSKFCIHAKGFEVNTARIGDALYYGCVPVILADHYDLPFADILNWNTFSVVVPTLDIPQLKKILQEMEYNGEYLSMYGNVLKVQNHFNWNHVPINYDAFYMVMYDLWLRRSSVRVPLY